MAKFIIQGGKTLSGKIKVSGSKNAVLPLMAACLLTKDKCRLENVPEVADVAVMFDILKHVGASVNKIEPHVYEIETTEIKETELPSSLVKKLRGSILLLAPLLVRAGKVKTTFPGGDIVGRRPIGIHFDVLEALGAEIKTEDSEMISVTGKLRGADFYLIDPSVTATENAIMAAVLAPGVTKIKFAACEPHVQDLCRFLTKMGAKIDGIGSQTLIIEGVDELRGANHRVISDYIEVGTFAAMAAACGGEVSIEDVDERDLDPLLAILDKMNVNYEYKSNVLTIKKSPNLKSTRIQVKPWPGIPSDIQPPLAVLATQATGVSLVHDWMYDRRLFYIDELLKMGADITLCDPHRALVYGPTKLVGTKIVSPDIRAGIALVIAALVAQGESEIDNIEIIDRGYEKIEERLRDLGADIKRVNGGGSGGINAG